MNKKEPFELRYFRFLPQKTKSHVENFLNNLVGPHRDFAVKRYLENKTIRVIAEEMGYEERSLYKYRNDIIDLWERFYDDHDDRFCYHRERILLALKRHGKMEYSKLLMNMNLRRSGLSLPEFKDILRFLIASGEVVCIYDESKQSGKKQKKTIALRKFVNDLSGNSNLVKAEEQEYAQVSFR